MTHDIIDNRNEKLAENIEIILSTSERARFAVGYLFLSGLKPIRNELAKLEEIRLLIGNTTNRETIETLAEDYKRLELLKDAVEEWQYPKLTAMRQSIDRTAENLRDTLALMDQTDEDEATIKTVLKLLEEAFRRAITSAVKKELNLLRRNGVTGDNLLQALKGIYFQHRLGDKENKPSRAEQEVPRIVCSMTLV